MHLFMVHQVSARWREFVRVLNKSSGWALNDDKNVTETIVYMKQCNKAKRNVHIVVSDVHCEKREMNAKKKASEFLQKTVCKMVMYAKFAYNLRS